MKICLLIAAVAVFLIPALPAAGADADVMALDKFVAGKKPLERNVEMNVHVVGYDLQRNPKARAQLQAVAQAGGGQFSTAGIKNITAVMSGVVSGGKKPQPVKRGSGLRLEYGESVVRHGRLER